MFRAIVMAKFEEEFGKTGSVSFSRPFCNSHNTIFRLHQLGIGAAAALVQRINGDSFSSIKNMKNWPSTSIHSERAKIIQNDRSFPFVPIF
jgi:hypothetical protein